MKVRNLRDERAAIEVKVESSRVDDAQKALRDRKKDLEDYAEFRQAEQDKEFNKVINKKVSLRALERTRTTVTGMLDEEHSHEKAVDDAGTHLEKKKQDLDRAKTIYFHIHRDLLKIEEHKTKWRETQTKVLERKEDAEFEDRILPRHESLDEDAEQEAEESEE